jgi:hypothetical protein
MQAIGGAVVLLGAVAVIVWRGVAMYNATFRRKDL